MVLVLWKILACASVVLLGCGMLIVRAEEKRPAALGSAKHWTLTQMTTGGKNVPIPPTPALAITFSTDGTVSGYSGINNFSASYRIMDKTIAWTTPFRSTRKGGSKELQALETTFMKVLQSCTSIAEGEALTLAGSEGALSFNRSAARD